MSNRSRKILPSMKVLLTAICITTILTLALISFSKQFVRQSTVSEVDQLTKVVVKYTLEKDRFSDSSELGNTLAGKALETNSIANSDLNDYFDAVMSQYSMESDEADQVSGSSRIGATTEISHSGGSAPISDSLEFSKDKTATIGSPNLFRESRKSVASKTAYGSEEFENTPVSQTDSRKLDLDGKKHPVGLEAEYDPSFFKVQRRRPNLSKFTIGVEKIKINSFFTSPAPSDEFLNDLNSLNNLTVFVDKEAYLRHELIRVNLVSREPINISELSVGLYYGGKPLKNFGYFSDSKFVYENNTIFATLFAGMNPPLGEYEVRVKSRKYLDWPGVSANLTINRRKVDPIPRGFSVINYESTDSLKARKVISPSGRMGSYENIANWVSYMDNDALWMLAGQTAGWSKNEDKEDPWIPQGIKNVDLLAAELKPKGLKLGAYMMSFYTPENGKENYDYSPSLGYNSATGQLEDTRFISLSDARRIKHMTTIVDGFQKNPNVDYIGFDFIRTGRADGYENGPTIVRDMNVATPLDYEDYTIVEKIRWFANKVEARDDERILIKWRMWRAHRVASIVGEILQNAKATKPAWVFTLGWDHGYEHGQDPYMFFDAGITIDAVMLYEASYLQFKHMMVQWPRYMTDNLNNMMIGNATDTRFLDGNTRFDREYLRRTYLGSTKIYRTSSAKGIFIHDISRALWSKRRGMNMHEWAIVHGAATSAYRARLGMIPYRGSIQILGDGKARIVVKNIGRKDIQKIKLRYSPTWSWAKISDNSPNTFSLSAGETKTFNVAYVPSKNLTESSLLGYYIDSPNYRRYFFYQRYEQRSVLDEAKLNKAAF